MRSRIMIVGRDVALRAQLARLLNGRGYHVEIAENAEHARRVGLEGVALAIVAPDGLGPEGKGLLQELRAAVGSVLVIAAPGTKRELRADVIDISDEAGLVARVAEALAPTPEADKVEPVLQFGGFRLDLAGHCLVDQAGKEVPLTSSEFSLLRAFLKRPGRVLSRDQLLQVLTGRDAEAYDRSIDMLIVRLRRKIESDPKRPRLIVTIPGSGYKFAARVTAEAIGALGEAQSESVAATVLPRPSAHGPERRQLTIMQCAMSGPAFQSAGRDPEDLHRQLTDFHESCAAIIAQTGGTVAKLLNDGVLAYFGYPQADEYQAERAIRAARGVIQASGRADAGQTNGIQARVAIATGLVLVGGLFRDSGEQAALGEPASLAAGLVAHAASSTVLISASTRRLVGELFQCQERGPIALPGFSEAIAVWQVVGEGEVEDRFEALHGLEFAALVGREEELALLLRRWDQAKAGEGQVVQLSGEAGIGKSRVLAALAERIGAEPHVRMRYQCSPHHVNDAFYPITSQIWRAAGFVTGEPAAARLDKLEAMIARSALEAKDIAPLLASLLSIPFDGRYSALDMAPGEQKERTIAALIALFEGLTKDAPVLVSLEDAHWIDPTSLDVFGRLVDSLPNLRALLVVTFRPEFASPWAGRAHAASLPLSRFGKRHTLALVDRVTRDKALPSEVLEQIVAKTDGVPLFVEELTKAVLGSGLLREENAAYVLVSALIPPAIPSTLQDSLMARLDRLAPVREIAQIAAVIGREFSYRLLEAVAPIQGPALQSALGQLMAAELIHGRGSPPEATYVFKHALVQDTAYASMLHSRRKSIHADIARAMEKLFADQVQASPAILAHHYSEAGLDDLAIEWWGKAGDQALRRSAFQEAISHLGKAIAMADKAAGGKVASVSGQRGKLQVAFGNALIAARGYAAPETTEAFAKAREAAGENAARERQSADYGLWAGSFVRGDLPSMRGHSAAFLSDVETRPDSPEAGVAHRTAGMTHWFAGEYREGREHLERALALFQPCRDDDLMFRFGIDAGVAAMLYLALTSWPLGDVQCAGSLVRGAEERIASIAHIATRAYGKMHAALFEFMRGDLTRAAARAVELARLAREHDLSMLRAWGVFLEGVATAEGGGLGEGLKDMRRGVELLREQKVLLFDGLIKIALAQTEACASDVDRAVAILDEALATSERTGHRAFEAELHRVRGEILLKRDSASTAPAERAFQTALAVAKEQGARSFELRAALALAKICQSTGRTTDAHAVLAPALEGFSPTPEMPEIAEAMSLSARLA
jgi:DNA-binding response OmpR family regulator/class 3 adenylate cyclase/predicted ATPase